jgi:hypothetical protein
MQSIILNTWESYIDFIVKIDVLLLVAHQLYNFHIFWKLPIGFFLRVFEYIVALLKHIVEIFDSQGLCHVKYLFVLLNFFLLVLKLKLLACFRFRHTFFHLRFTFIFLLGNFFTRENFT